MWFLALILGLIYIIQFLWILLGKEKNLTVLNLIIFGILALFIICMFSYVLIFSIENMSYYTILILLEMIGVTLLNF